MTPPPESALTDPLRGSGPLHLLLEELEAADLARFVRYWEQRHDRFRESGDGFSSWKASSILSAGLREVDRRGLIAWPPTSGRARTDQSPQDTSSGVIVDFA